MNEPPETEQHTNEAEILAQRRAKLQMLLDQGVQPFGGRFERSHANQFLVDHYEEGLQVKVAGRVTARRLHGKAAFCDLRDQSGTIQCYFKGNQIGAESFQRFVDAIDMGDFLGVSGPLFKTRTEQVSVQVEQWEVLSKALRPLPAKWHGLQDVETRYRRRYLDLVANPEVARVFEQRSRIVDEIRAYLRAKNFLEVETPMMQSLAGGAAGEPFVTHHNALDTDLYLRLAPELFLKRLLVGGFDRVYEMNRNFRNEGLSPRHNPEFTMLELYEAYSDCRGMMDITRELILHVAEKVFGSTTLTLGGKEVNLGKPWKELSFAQLMEEHYGILPSDPLELVAEKLSKDNPDLSKEARAGGKKLSKGMMLTKIMTILQEQLEPSEQAEPIFMTDFLTVTSPLAKSRPDNPYVVERFELFMGGMELANGYSELNDPIDQKKRFEEQLASSDKKAASVDEDFVTALEHGMPPAGGLGIGIDRLVMLLTGQPSIKDVILFPQLRPLG